MNDNLENESVIHDGDVEALLERAEKRPVPPVEDELAIRDSVQAEWLVVTRRRRITRYGLRFVAAATLLLAVFLAIVVLQPSVTEVRPVASIEYRFGLIYQVGAGSELTEADSVNGISAGDVIRTGENSGMAIGWNAGGSVRIDQNSRVEFVSGESIRLHSGRLYFDSAPLSASNKSATLTVLTEMGEIAHVGTQYMVETVDHSLIVSVRDGHVEVQHRTGERIAAVGSEQVQISEAGLRSRLAISTYGGPWSWVDLTTPPQNIDGRSVDFFLNWVAHETGLRVNYASAEVRAMAEDDKLTGHVEAQPLGALDIWRQATDLDWQVEGGVIYVNGSQQTN